MWVNVSPNCACVSDEKCEHPHQHQDEPKATPPDVFHVSCLPPWMRTAHTRKTQHSNYGVDFSSYFFFISKSQKSMKSNSSQICVSEHFSFANRTTSIVHEREYFLIGFGQWAHVSCVHSSIFPLIHCFPPFCLLFLQDPSLWPSDDSIHLVSEQFLVPEEGLEGIRCGEGHFTRRVRLLSCWRVPCSAAENVWSSLRSLEYEKKKKGLALSGVDKLRVSSFQPVTEDKLGF